MAQQTTTARRTFAEDIDELIEDTRISHSNDDGETFLECVVCGDWEGHTDECPMPHLIAELWRENDKLIALTDRAKDLTSLIAGLKRLAGHIRIVAARPMDGRI
jgi:hypothetical protein